MADDAFCVVPNAGESNADLCGFSFSSLGRFNKKALQQRFDESLHHHPDITTRVVTMVAGYCPAGFA
jgi:hypothetical protein|tara:strand:- start:5162 stop:5362 length:201 start_codon:yes stop_codon:yes gene_type:complete